MHGLAPPYLDQLICVVVAICAHHHHHTSCTFLHIVLQPLAAVRFQLLELFSTWHSVICFLVYRLPASKDTSVSSVLSRRVATINRFRRLRFRGLRNNICYFGDVNELWLTFAYCICPAGGWRQWMDRGWAGSAGKGSGSVPRWRSRPMGENLSDGWKIGQRGVCVHCIDRIRTR